MGLCLERSYRSATKKQLLGTSVSMECPWVYVLSLKQLREHQEKQMDAVLRTSLPKHCSVSNPAAVDFQHKVPSSE